MVTPRIPVILLLLAVSLLVRLLPWTLALNGGATDPGQTSYPWNISPFLPLCIFGGAVYAQPRVAYAVPFIAFFLGDLGILALSGRPDWAFYPYQPLVYLSVALVATTGVALRGHRTWRGIAMAGLVSSTGYFVLTNFGTWAFGGGEVYPLTPAGLLECYVRAIPYFRNTLMSMALFLPLLFSRVSLRTVRPGMTPGLVAERA